ncbi:MAG: hypothetical protein MO852_01455 [Candidatus Devosia euplotis]|nr:hypothetical protein [Candidatus Devosia euplotis]
MRQPAITLAVGFGIVALMFDAYIMNPTGTEAFPASEPEFGTVNVIARGNYSPAEIRDLLVEVEDQILQVEGIQDVIMSFAGGTGSGGLGGQHATRHGWHAQPAADALCRTRQGGRDLSKYPRAGCRNFGPGSADRRAGRWPASRQGYQYAV